MAEGIDYIINMCDAEIANVRNASACNRFLIAVANRIGGFEGMFDNLNAVQILNKLTINEDGKFTNLRRDYRSIVDAATSGKFVIAASPADRSGHGHVAIIVGGEQRRSGIIPLAYWGHYNKPQLAGRNVPISQAWNKKVLETTLLCFVGTPDFTAKAPS